MAAFRVAFRNREALDRHLPEARFPELRARRLNYPHLRKLTDIHCWRRGWTLVLDFDMLFFREPRFLLDWLAAPATACHMLDAMPAYGYSTHLMEELAGHPIPPLVNVGFCGLRSDAIDWDELERWCKELVAREGMSYFLEQAITAMLVAGKPRAEASAVDYRVLPDLLEGRAPLRCCTTTSQNQSDHTSNTVGSCVQKQLEVDCAVEFRILIAILTAWSQKSFGGVRTRR